MKDDGLMKAVNEGRIEGNGLKDIENSRNVRGFHIPNHGFGKMTVEILVAMS